MSQHSPWFQLLLMSTITSVLIVATACFNNDLGFIVAAISFNSDLGSSCNSVFLQWPWFPFQQRVPKTVAGRAGCIVHR